MPSPGNSPLDRTGDRRGSSRERDSRRLDSTDDRGGVEYPPRPSSRNQMERRDRGREVSEDSRYWDRRQRDEGGPREDGRPRDDGRRYIDDGRRPGDRGPDRGMERGADRAFDRRPDRGGRASGRDGPESSRHEAGSGRGRDGPESGRYDGGSGRAGVQPAAAASGPGMAGRQPSSRSGRHSRGHTPPATTREWNSAGGSERGTPVQTAPAPRRTGGTPLGRSSLLAELIQAGKQKQQQETAPGSDEDAEAGEILPDAEEQPAAAARKRKHSPIVWDGGASKQARGGPGPSGLAPGPAVGESLLERTQREALALRLMDIDPDAPAAMKASPSLSFDGDQEDAGGASKDDSQEGHANGDASVQPATGKSRWAMLQEEEDEEERGGGPTASGPDAAAGAAGSASPAGIEGPGALEGAQGPSSHRGAAGFGSDSDDEDGGREKAAQPAEMLYDMRKGCRDVHDFERIEKISEGAYGVVYKAREKSTGRIVALKRIKMERQTEGFPVTSVREINILLNFHHPNIVRVEEVVVSPRQADQIFMVMEYMDHDLKSLMDDKKRYSQPFSTGQVKCLMQQLLAGVAFLHHHWVLHRDLKTSNILYNGHGDLKLCDFGMARQYGEPLGNYTTLVVTLWYRAPELLFGAKKYSTAVDMWSVGCIMGEILTGKPLLPGQGEFDQIDKMVQLLGTPTTEEWPGLEQLPEFKKISLKKVPSQLRQRFTASTGFVGGGTSLTESGLDLLARLLQWNPDKRISAADALNHPWFSEAPKPVARVLMPTFAPRKAS